MNWRKWSSRKERNLIGVILFIIAYTLTIPIRGYEFLDGFIDTTQGVPIWMHLIIIAVGGVVLIILLKIIDILIKKFVIKK